MMPGARLLLAAALAFAFADATAQEPAPLTVHASGEVGRAGTLELPGTSRLADLVKNIAVKPEAYVLGAAWLRPSLRPEQARLKAGLLYELGSIHSQAQADGRSAVAELAMRLHAWVEQMPASGRKAMPTLEPHALQVIAYNPPLAEGDTLYYPPRPDTVAVVGAVVQRCDLPHAGLQDARVYLSQCKPMAVADPDVLYVIQPDGKVFVQGIALWNRSPPMTVAPGAVLYVPISRRAMRFGPEDTFNRDMAEFIATQPLGGTDIEP